MRAIRSPSPRQSVARTAPRQQMLAASLLACVVVLSSAPAFAQQALERNLPERAPDEPVTLDIGAQDFGTEDSTPLGVDLHGVHLIGQDEPVAEAPPPGITGAPVGIDAQALSAALQPLLAHPLSLALASEVQAAIARIYRQAGFPFVSVTLPPQEITGGVLQVRIIEFKAGTVTVNGVTPDEAVAIAADLRVEKGGQIDARALNEDLVWLNRSPYRRASGMFRPGEETGESDLTVTVTPGKPWQVYGGWSNSGSADTGRDRFYIGGNARLPGPTGAFLSYQLTTSDEVWSDPSIIFPTKGAYPDYVSQAGRLTIPILSRQSLEIAPSFVATRQQANSYFDFENTTYELPVIYRSAISNFAPGHYWGDIYGGVELKRLERTTYFDDVAVGDGAADLFQLVLGWNNAFSDPLGQTAVDVSIRANPGGVLQGNAATTWQTFSNGRVDSVTYAYLAADIEHAMPLPARLSWISALSATLSGVPLPDTERISLGGRYAVRGYNYDDVSVDSGFIWRNELRLPSIAPLAGHLPESLPALADNLSPYAFADIGFGVDHDSGDTATLSGIGAGFDYRLGNSLTVNFIAGVALHDAGVTQAGNWNLQAAITGRF
ncbi:ShlB/FhaC/HecB family hemolysin secretion/activation protein [Martelella sp. HB161492]|uniref:ShlB/FhaC/HecB family hemolysin secretion/activation protein n=1 Tax=Martelella sp. HB161492 TaxID=2720726 RepID=UPI001FEFB3C7|nr:ShlB/FhaC/HecB family hemolysin secretion/activation protein [Martelella sp. HB161492]